MMIVTNDQLVNADISQLTDFSDGHLQLIMFCNIILLNFSIFRTSFRKRRRTQNYVRLRAKMEKFPNKSTILDIKNFEKFSMIFVEMA